MKEEIGIYSEHYIIKNTPNFNRILRFWMKNVPWLIQFFIAALQCSALDNPGNAVKSGYGCTGASSIYGTSCLFSCMMGYHAVGGSLKRTCLQNGKWSGTKLQCEGKKGMIPWIEKSHFVYFSGSGADVVVRGLTLHSTTVAWVRSPTWCKCGLRFLRVLLQVLRFSSLRKNQHSKFLVDLRK